MNTSELKAERIRQNKSTEYMASLIEKTVDTYAKKERGEVKFSPEETVAVANDLGLDIDKFNAIFFDGELLIGNLLRFYVPNGDCGATIMQL